MSQKLHLKTGTINTNVKKVRRLYPEFKPEHYSLGLAPSRELMTFSGKVEVTGKKAGRPSHRITLHQKNLKITGAKITKYEKSGQTKDVVVERINLHRSYDEVRLHAKEMLYPGKYTIELQFSGTITAQMHGMYPCNFKHDDRPASLIATQFESHHAREVFPCIDEPEAKATFELSLTTPAGETVLSNTPIKLQNEKNGHLVTCFETTPRMSTYLLAFVYGKLEYLEAKTKSGVMVRTYATPHNVKFTEFALEVGVKTLDFFEEYFDIPYPLPKLDMVALPDFASGAMENWGLITYREQALLVDPNNTDTEAKQYVAMVVTHELAHQWFGNLVTMRWWTDLWLNEGFASWIEFLATDKLFPQWDMWTQFIATEQLHAQKLDALHNTHPVEVPVDHPDEIRTIFDAISYQKGGSVIHMLYGYLGEEAFRDGIRHYLKKFAYQNTETEDLWQALQDESGKPVKDFMHSWVSTPGYPLVKVAEQDGNLMLSQERFFILPDPERKNESLWPIPLNCIDLPADILTDRDLKLKWSKPIPLINEGHSGFFSTVYNEAAYERFGQAIEDQQIPEPDRLGLLNDMFSAAKAGYLPTLRVLQMLRHFHGEHSAPVWDVLTSVLGDIRRVFDTEEVLEDMKPYIHKITQEQVKRLGWHPKSSEPHFDTLLRPLVLGLAAMSGNKEVEKESLKRFEAMHHPEDEHPDIRSVIYQTAVRRGGKAEFDKLLEFYKTSSSAAELMNLASALTNFRQPNLYETALGLIKTDLVRQQDLSFWIANSFRNRHAKQAAWDWLKDNWEWTKLKIGSDLGFSRLPIYAANNFANTDFRDELVKFFEPRLTPSIAREYRQALEIIDWQTAWRSRDEASIAEFFKSHK